MFLSQKSKARDSSVNVDAGSSAQQLASSRVHGAFIATPTLTAVIGKACPFTSKTAADGTAWSVGDDGPFSNGTGKPGRACRTTR